MIIGGKRMGEYVQLHMRHPDLSKLAPLYLKEGMGVHTHVPGEEAKWEEIIEKSFGMPFSFRNWLVPLGGYKPEYVMYVSYHGVDCATAMGTENPKFPGEGWMRMVGTAPEAAGHGLGKLAVLAALHSLAGRGYKTAVLSTDDHRLPAIAVYKSLGFEPVFIDPSHEERWKKVEEALAAHKKN